MARRDLDDIRKEIDLLKQKGDLGEEYQNLLQEEQDLIEKITNSRKAEVKVGQAAVRAAKERQSAEDDVNNSLSKRLTMLVKGNVAGALGIGNTGELAKRTRDLKVEYEDVLKSIRESGVGITDQAKLTEIAGQAKEGSLIDEKLIQAEISGISGANVNIMDELVRKKQKENQISEKTNVRANILNKLLVGGGVIFGSLLAIASKFADTVDAIGKQFGSLNVLSKGFQNNLINSQEAVIGLGATMEDVVATANELSSEFGIGLTESAGLSAQIIDTAKAIGLSNEEAAKLSGILQTTSGLSSEQAERLSEGAFQLAAANNVNPSAVLRDMAASSEEFAQFSKDGGDNLARAAVQARAMGLSLADTTKIASGLLDFEQSIAAEVEASVLIGRQLNLQKARELALNNDIEGAMRAVVDQLGSEAEFNRLNSIQRDALAKSIGVEASQLAKMVANSERANEVAGETAKSFADIIGKDAMSELTATMNELKRFGVAVANTLGPPLMALAKLVNFVLIPAGELISGISGGIRNMIGNTTTMNDGIVGPGGVTAMTGPAGTFKLNPRDSVMATTNPITMNNPVPAPTNAMGEKQTVVMNARVRGRDLVFLSDRPGAGGDAGYEGLA